MKILYLCFLLFSFVFSQSTDSMALLAFRADNPGLESTSILGWSATGSAYNQPCEWQNV